jgi:allantoinase
VSVETSPELVIRARRAVVGSAERACAVAVRDGRIAAVEAYDADLDAAEEVLLAADEVLLPGLVDTHVHVNEPGRTEWEGFGTATRAAAAGGVTTIVDMPLNSIPSTTTVEALEVKRAAARDQVHVDVGFWGGAVPDNDADLAPLHDEGVFGFKCFLVDSGVEEFPPLSAEQFTRAMDTTASIGALMIVHAEDADALAHAPHSGGPSYASFLASRPPEVEQAAVARVAREALRTGGRTHVLHVSSADVLPVIAEARSGGADLTAETCPHYLALAADDVPDGATEFKCCPPIRDAGNQDRLWKGLADGTLDLVVSDHSPCTVDLKQRGGGDFDQAWGGIASVQVSLPAVWTAARERGVPLADVVRLMATAPADRVGLLHKGRIAVGADADLCVLAPEETFVVDPAVLRHRNPVSANAGARLHGVVRRTYLRGAEVDLDGAPRGRLLRRGQR